MAENNSEIDIDQIWTELSSSLDSLSDEIPQQPNINIHRKAYLTKKRLTMLMQKQNLLWLTPAQNLLIST